MRETNNNEEREREREAKGTRKRIGGGEERVERRGEREAYTIIIASRKARTMVVLKSMEQMRQRMMMMNGVVIPHCMYLQTTC